MVAKTTKAKKQKITSWQARGKRKEAVARATIAKGSGKIYLNRYSITTIEDPHMQALICKPVRIAGQAANNIDIKVNVFGGGQMGQAQAAATAIARAILKYSNDDPSLKAKYSEYDRSLVVEDSRRVEPKKYKGPKARARFQKSYR
ncbi:30S ribosomal protein S9 [Candidatus Parvarchaeota archaeon]|nr:30S ribosomal protein S9 [Candidatus Parvarchaeota archaeon]